MRDRLKTFKRKAVKAIKEAVVEVARVIFDGLLTFLTEEFHYLV